MGKPSSSDLIRSLGKILKPKSLLITDSLFSYKILSSYCKLSHVAILSEKHGFKNYNIQKVNSLRSNLKRFISKYSLNFYYINITKIVKQYLTVVTNYKNNLQNSTRPLRKI